MDRTAEDIDIDRWQIARIKEALRQAEAGEFAADDEVAEALARWRP